MKCEVFYHLNEMCPKLTDFYFTKLCLPMLRKFKNCKDCVSLCFGKVKKVLQQNQITILLCSKQTIFLNAKWSNAGFAIINSSS